MKSTKIISLILALIMLLSVALVGCSSASDNGKKDEGKPAVKTDEEDTSAVYDAEIHDMHGHKFWFIVRTTTHTHLDTNEIYAEELNGDKINDAVFKRNAALQEKYNCEIYEERNTDPAKAVREQLIAGEYQYDYIYTSISSLRTLSASNLLVDFYTLEQVDLEKAWWDQNAIRGMSIAGKAFYVTGDAGTLDDRASWLMYFNKDVIEKARLESPYKLVSEGKWTIEKMYEYMMATIEDMNGDGVYEIGTDRMAYIGERLNNWMHVAACNVYLSRMSSGGDIEIPATISEEMLNVWNALKPVLTSEYRDVADSGSRFRNGHATFFSCNAGAILTFGASSVNFGILPMPKLNEEQEEYWTSIHSYWTYGFAIPTACDNTSDYEQNGFTSGREQAAYFLEAFSYYSMDTLTVAFYDQVMKRQLVKDLESAEMIDIGLRNKLYDPVVIFNFGNIGTTLFSQAGCDGFGGSGAPAGVTAKGSDVNYDTLVSTYESRVEAARKALNNYINYITVDD
ncbi:MAG: hypothetical protein II776_03110 [Clostridia bacterium]|nr:hypothetical protein [Clostridia bacterium]